MSRDSPSSHLSYPFTLPLYYVIHPRRDGLMIDPESEASLTDEGFEDVYETPHENRSTFYKRRGDRP